VEANSSSSTAISIVEPSLILHIMASVPLSDRDVNAHLKNTTNNVSDQKPTKTSEGDNKPFPAHMRAKSGDTISPSDAIQSPASQKLAGMKGRKFAR